SGLLIGGIVPGLILSALFVGYIVARAVIDPTLAPNEELPPAQGLWERWRPFLIHVLPLVMIFAIVVGAMTGGWATPTEAAVVVGMMLILLFLGCFVDQVSMMLITLPFFMPLVQRLDIEPIWFGVLFLICMQLGLLTPPFGLLLFTMKGVAPPSITMSQVYAAAVPYIVFGLIVLVAIFFVPTIATWLPGMLGN